MSHTWNAHDEIGFLRHTLETRDSRIAELEAELDKIYRSLEDECYATRLAELELEYARKWARRWKRAAKRYRYIANKYEQIWRLWR